MAEVAILTFKEFMGHRTQAMTLRYAHLSPTMSNERLTCFPGEHHRCGH